MAVDLNERSREIGVALRRARTRMKKSVRECARFLGTSPRRYAAIEQGATFIGAPELEAMVEFLGIPPFEVWPQQVIEATTRQINLEAWPGENLQILVTIAVEPKSELNDQSNFE